MQGVHDYCPQSLLCKSAEAIASSHHPVDHQGVTREEGVFETVIIYYIFAHMLSLSYKIARKL